MSIKTDSFGECVVGIACDGTGYIYVVDQKGRIVTHPKRSSGDTILDYSFFSPVQKVIKGETGIEISSDPLEEERQLVAYVPVLPYLWGVIVVQSERTAFAARNGETMRLGIIFSLGVLIIGFTLYRILSDRILMKMQRDRETALLESIGDGVIAIDKDWNIVQWNKAASLITLWSKEEAIGKPFRDIIKLIRERDRIEDDSSLEQAMIQEKTVSFSDHMLLVRKDGSEIPVSDSAAPVFAVEGALIGAIMVFRDISLEREENNLRSDFAYASHQLRTPITEALWNLEVALDEQDLDKRKEDIEIAHQSLLNVKKLSEHLVFVSAIDQGHVVIRPSLVKVVDIFSSMQEKIRDLAEVHGVSVSFEPILSVFAINTDKRLLEKTLFELLENAILYSPRGSSVIVQASLHEEKVLFEVVDAGVGIPEEEQTIIFTKFFRGSNRGSDVPGDGLGLYVAKKSVALLHGKIWFESTEGKGTTFFISLPVS